MSWEEFQAQAYQEPDTGIYVVNGDEIAYDVDALRLDDDARQAFVGGIQARLEIPAMARRAAQLIEVRRPGLPFCIPFPTRRPARGWPAQGQGVLARGNNRMRKAFLRELEHLR